MITAAMIAFAVVLPHQLPIAFFDDGRRVRDFGIRKVVDFEIWLSHLGESIEIRWSGGQADVDQAIEIAKIDGLQTMF